MKKLSILFLFMIIALGYGYAQQTKISIYNPQADAKADINAAVKKAASENKHVLLQIGGNWCPWCVKLHKLLHTDATIDSVLKADYVFVMVNYSKENKNLPVLKELGFPQRFGFPVLVVLDKTGKRLNTQDTSLLEAGNGYDADKVLEFLKGWTVSAIDPLSYEK
jgi:thioredoxin-related protein